MKKVLLATTILGMTSGFAAAEIAFTGEATAGFASVQGNDMETYTSFKLSIAASGETDSGLAFGASTSIASGKSYDFDEDGSSEFDHARDSLVNLDDDNNGVMQRPEVFVSGDFGKISFKENGYDDLANDSFDGNDVKYTHSIAGFDIAVAADVTAASNATGPALGAGNTAGNGAGTGEVSASIGYTIEGITLKAAVDGSDDSSFVSASGVFGPITAGLKYDDNKAEVEPVTTLSLAYSMDAIKVGVDLADNDTWDANVAYTASGLTLKAKTDEAEQWEVTAEYDLGGGLAAHAGTNSKDDAFVGAKMKF